LLVVAVLVGLWVRAQAAADAKTNAVLLMQRLADYSLGPLSVRAPLSIRQPHLGNASSTSSSPSPNSNEHSSLRTHHRRVRRSTLSREKGRAPVQKDARNGPPSHGRQGSHRNLCRQTLQRNPHQLANPLPPRIFERRAAGGRIQASRPRTRFIPRPSGQPRTAEQPSQRAAQPEVNRAEPTSSVDLRTCCAGEY